MYFHQIRSQVLNPRVLHHENVAEDRVQSAAIPSGAAHRAFSDDEILFFDHAGHANRGAPHECVIFNLSVERLLAVDVKGARYQPLDIVRQTGQYRRVIRVKASMYFCTVCLFWLMV